MSKKPELPGTIAAFVKAVNEHNTDDFLAVFADTAVIFDEGHEYRGITAIREWNAEKNIGAKITLDPVEATERNGSIVLTAAVDGDFDKTGLPDPFLMDLHFTLDQDMITSLKYSLAGE